jgi:hypothetical protein
LTIIFFLQFVPSGSALAKIEPNAVLKPSGALAAAIEAYKPERGSGCVPSAMTACSSAGSRPSARNIVGATCVV